jgi:hypothetical protein
VKSPDNYAGTSTQVDNPYCWQVALQQSLRPLQDYGCMLRNIFENFTNHFLPHYPKLSPIKNPSDKQPEGFFFLRFAE